MICEGAEKMRKMKKKNWNLIIGCILGGSMLLLAIVGQFWTPYDPTQMNAVLKNQAPTLAHIMGTDNFGRDIFSRIMSGAWTTCFVAICTVLIGAAAGTVVGAVTGYFGGVVDHVVMRINDVLLSFPSVLLALVLVSLLGPGKNNIILALGILFIPSFARIVRSEFIRIRQMDFVWSARIMGAGSFRIMFVHILPNTLVSMLTAAAIGFNNAVLAEASMSYLGLGVQPPETSLGRMLFEAQTYLFNAPWYALFPGLTIVCIVLGFSLISEGLRAMGD